MKLLINKGILAEIAKSMVMYGKPKKLFISNIILVCTIFCKFGWNLLCCTPGVTFNKMWLVWYEDSRWQKLSLSETCTPVRPCQMRQ